MNVLDRSAPPRAAGQDEDGKDEGPEKDRAPGAPQVLVVRTPDERLIFLQPIGSRRRGDVGGGIPGRFTGSLITDGYTGYQHLLERLAGIQQCAQHDREHGHAARRHTRSRDFRILTRRSPLTAASSKPSTSCRSSTAHPAGAASRECATCRKDGTRSPRRYSTDAAANCSSGTGKEWKTSLARWVSP